jgi:hypothetical protein
LWSGTEKEFFISQFGGVDDEPGFIKQGQKDRLQKMIKFMP